MPISLVIIENLIFSNFNKGEQSTRGKTTFNYGDAKSASLNIYFILVFSLSEIILLVIKRSKRSSVKSRNDRKSLLFLWITITSSLTIAYAFSWNQIRMSGRPTTLEIFGIVMFILGFVIRWIAIFQLGRMFTVDVSIANNHVLKTNGLYSMVRHPSYLGLLLILAGLSFLLNNLITSVIILPIFTAIIYRISIEEKELLTEFGNQYRLYIYKIKKIIPLIY
ncbi:MAG TPA: isoprenylcysteine carboxylmethyltransferase family protein [Puia sp.]|nr:isoprenylcysteine carboxylmethyltransferase family protein [Puia sp.]